jgi:hypothetical protein
VVVASAAESAAVTAAVAEADAFVAASTLMATMLVSDPDPRTHGCPNTLQLIVTVPVVVNVCTTDVSMWPYQPSGMRS